MKWSNWCTTVVENPHLRHTFRDTHFRSWLRHTSCHRLYWHSQVKLYSYIMLYTLFNEDSESGDNGRPPGSILRSFNNDLPHTLDFFSLRDNYGYTKKGVFRGGKIAHFHQLHLWRFQGKSHVALASLDAIEADADTHRSVQVEIFLNATPWIIDVHEDWCRYSCRNINIRSVFEITDARIKIGSANWDGNAGGGTGSGAGRGTGSGAGRGTGSGAGRGTGRGTGSGAGRGTGSGAGRGTGSAAGRGTGRGTGSGAGRGTGSGAGSGAGRGTGSGAGRGTGSAAGSSAGSDDGSGPGTIRMVGFVATVATPPTPAWMCCRAMVLWLAHFRAQLKKDLLLIQGLFIFELTIHALCMWHQYWQHRQEGRQVNHQGCTLVLWEHMENGSNVRSLSAESLSQNRWFEMEALIWEKNGNWWWSKSKGKVSST